jgi:hypothetical protein
MTDLAERVREALPASRVREQRMFGGLAFMLDDRLLVCVQRENALLVRVARTRDAELMARPGTGRLRMGAKQLDAGWILVDGAALRARRSAPPPPPRTPPAFVPRPAPARPRGRASPARERQPS